LGLETVHKSASMHKSGKIGKINTSFGVLDGDPKRTGASLVKFFSVKYLVVKKVLLHLHH